MEETVEYRHKKFAFTYGETANVVGVSPSMIRKQVRLGQLECIKIGRSVRIPLHAILRLCGMHIAGEALERLIAESTGRARESGR